MYGNKPPAARRLAQPPQKYADGGMVARMKSADAGPATFGSRGLSQLRDMIPKMQAMGYPQQAAAAPAAADARAAQLQAMIPQVEAMGYKQQPQRLADGGFVSAAKRMMGLTPTDPAQAAALAEYKANAAREKAAAKMATAPAPAPQAAIAEYTGMSATERRMKAQSLADGGVIRGPGTGTSDSIKTEAEPGTYIMPADSTKAIGPSVLERLSSKVPVRLSNGEYKFPPEQVMAVGAAVLEAMKDSTHEAAEEVEDGEPEQALASGGMVENDVTRVGNSYSGGNVGGDITVNGAATGGTFSQTSATRMGTMPAPATAPVAAPPAAAAAPIPAPASQPAAAPAPAPAAPMGWAERNAQRSNQVTASSIVDSPERRAAQAALGRLTASEDAEPAPARPKRPLPAPVQSEYESTQPSLWSQPRRYANGGMVEDDLQSRLAQSPTGGPTGWTGGGQAAPAAPAEVQTPAPPAAPAAPAGALSRAASYLPPTPAPEPSRVSQTLGTAPRQIPSNAGEVGAQDATAAQVLARRGAGDAIASLPNAPPPLAAPTVRNSTNDWAARKALENAATAASSITANGSAWDKSGPGGSQAQAVFKAALATDQALQQAQPGLDAAAMRENSESGRALLRDRGDTMRTGLQVATQADQASADREAALARMLIGERGANARAGITAQAQTEAARIKALQDNKPPAGYRWAAGGKLEPIPGGPAADGKPLTEDQAKSSGYALRMDNALKLIDEIGKSNPGAIRPGLMAAATNALPEGLANQLRPEARQRVEAAQLDALDAALTLNTGAAYTREQLQGLSRSYFAQPGDDDKTVADKGNRLQSLIDTARLRAGEKGAAMTDAAQAKNAARTGGAMTQPAASSSVPDDIGALLKKYGG